METTAPATRGSPPGRLRVLGPLVLTKNSPAAYTGLDMYRQHSQRRTVAAALRRLARYVGLIGLFGKERPREAPGRRTACSVRKLEIC